MTDTFKNDPDGYTRADFDHDRDPLLVALRAALVDDKEEGEQGHIGVTLSVKGSVFSGKLVSMEAWAAAFKDTLSATSQPGLTSVGKGVAQGLMGWSDERREEVARRDAAGLPTPRPAVMCLQDAYLLLDANTPVKLGLVRVLTSEVDAWAVGSVSPAVE